MALLLLIVACLVARISSFAVNIDAHEKACFFDVVKAGTKMGLTFQVAEGGFLDIDVAVSAAAFSPCVLSLMLREHRLLGLMERLSIPANENLMASSPSLHTLTANTRTVWTLKVV